MDTFHGAIADTGYYMHEGVPSDAAFLTPIALLTGGQAFKDALKVASGVASTTPQYEKRVDVAKISVYFVVLLRWCAMPLSWTQLVVRVQRRRACIGISWQPLR